MATEVKNAPVLIALGLIVADEALQPRVSMNQEHRERIARGMADGDVPPPVHVFFDGKTYWLADGFHRYHAMCDLKHMGRKFQSIRCVVHEGSRRDAVIFAATANVANTALPMSVADRGKALWSLLDDPEMRKKSVTNLTKIVGLSNTKGRSYWREYFTSKGLDLPEYCEAKDGRIRPNEGKKRINTTDNIPPIRSTGGKIRMTIAKRRFCLSNDIDVAEQERAQIIEAIESNRRRYESSSRISELLLSRNVDFTSIYRVGSRPKFSGVFGGRVNGVAITWDPLRKPSDIVPAIGRAVCCRADIGATRAVVLCPVEDGPPEILELGRKAGIEFMTIEDFVASLKPEGVPPD